MKSGRARDRRHAVRLLGASGGEDPCVLLGVAVVCRARLAEENAAARREPPQRLAREIFDLGVAQVHEEPVDEDDVDASLGQLERRRVRAVEVHVAQMAVRRLVLLVETRDELDGRDVTLWSSEPREVRAKVADARGELEYVPSVQSGKERQDLLAVVRCMGSGISSTPAQEVMSAQRTHRLLDLVRIVIEHHLLHRAVLAVLVPEPLHEITLIVIQVDELRRHTTHANVRKHATRNSAAGKSSWESSQHYSIFGVRGVQMSSTHNHIEFCVGFLIKVSAQVHAAVGFGVAAAAAAGAGAGCGEAPD
eukprot:7315831-Prymnesium_polylepis.1